MIKGPMQYFWNKRAALVTMLVGLTVFSAVGVVYTKHQSRMLYAKLQQLHNKKNELHVEWSQLLLEQGAWTSDARVEKVAREQLGMYIPLPSQITVVWP